MYLRRKSLLKMLAFTLIIIIIINVTNYNAYAKKAEVKFKNMNAEDGLSQATANNIIQDSRGFMWIGTSDGLNRYDGHNFKVYRRDPENKNSLNGNFIYGIAEDENEMIWVGTHKGLHKLNPYTDEITRYTHVEGEDSLSNDNVTAVIKGKDGIIWVGTQDGLNKFNINSGKFTVYKKTDYENSLSNNHILSLFIDSEGILWIGTESGLNAFYEDDEKFVRYINDEDDKNSISHDMIYSISEDSYGYIWIGTDEGGLNRYDKKEDVFRKYLNDIMDPKSIPSNKVQYVYEDRNKNLWIGTKDGLSKYDRDKENFINYFNNINNKYSLVDNDVISMYQDESGMIWVGTYKGVSIFNPDTLFYHYKRSADDENGLNDDMIGAIYEDDDNVLWVGTNTGGLNRIDRNTNEVKHYLYDENNPNTISNNKVSNIIEDSNGVLWIGTDEGLNKFDKENEIFTRYQSDPNDANSIIDNRIKYIFEDSEGIFWVGTRKGLEIFDREKEIFKHMPIVEDGTSVNDEYIRYLYEDREGILWIGTVWGGLNRYDRETNSFKYYKEDPNNTKSLSYNSIKCITEDNEGNLWVGTNDGLNKFDKKTETFKVYTEIDGLPNSFIYGILVDNENNLWLSTNRGISKLITSKDKFINFDTFDGLQSEEFNVYSFFKSKSGEMFFGGVNGFNSFYPEDVTTKQYVPNIVISDFKVFDESKNLSDEIKLSYKENFFSIEFMATDFKNPNKNNYAYMLEGIDRGWIYSGKRNYVSYNNLEGGEYTFKVKATNSNGVWNENPKIIKIIIEKPPWERWWAYFIYAAMISLLVFFIINYVRILENLVSQRTKQLNNKLKENKDLYKKIIKYEKFKNDFFINLSHELRTPLNLILSSLQLTDNYYNKGQYDKLINVYHNQSDIIKKNAIRQLKVVNNLIDTAKISNGQYNISKVETDIIFLVEEIALSMKGFIESNGISLVIDPEVEEKIIECDPNEIERIMINLISNAVKFTPKGGTISINVYDKGNDIEIYVRDTGIGIPERQKKYVFERFKQVENNISNKKNGSGIGLSLVKMLVELHGGSIRVESELEKGSEFIIKLPVKINSDNETEEYEMLREELFNS